ncbi:hypothetical protein O181_013406, partial [Austropuccinia psidii MF-1]|nr:hypothetical protein [Austropuccinia psidii MF-1]
FEEPNSNCRWDNPLITFNWFESLQVVHNHNNDQSNLLSSSSSSPNDDNNWSKLAQDLWIAVTQGDLKPVHAAVKMPTPSSTNFLHLLEVTTNSLVTSFLSSLKDSPISYGPITFSSLLPISNRTRSFSINVPIGKTVNIGLLQRLKRQYTTIHKHAKAVGRGSSEHDENEIAVSFVDYLQGAL